MATADPVVLAAAFHAAVSIVVSAATTVAAVSHAVVSIVALATMAVASTALTALGEDHHSVGLVVAIEDLAASAFNIHESIL